MVRKILISAMALALVVVVLLGAYYGFNHQPEWALPFRVLGATVGAVLGLLMSVVWVLIALGGYGVLLTVWDDLK